MKKATTFEDLVIAADDLDNISDIVGEVAGI